MISPRLLIALFASLLPLQGTWLKDGLEMAGIFAAQVDRRLTVPDDEIACYADLLGDSLAAAGQEGISNQYVFLVDRSPHVQAILIYWISENGIYRFIGASAVTTGRPGRYEYFETQTGVYHHTTDNPDYRAEGTRNEFGIRGYGKKGMRVYDFGWVKAPKGWGDRRESVMRLQMHATDPDRLEQFLGRAGSKGCVRIPASLNILIDRYGLLDGDYEEAMAGGRKFYVMLPTREPTPWSGRFLVVVDSGRNMRPAWSPSPKAP